MFGFVVVRQGDRVAVWNRQGAVRFVDGPRRFLAWGKQIHRLPRFTASPTEYVCVKRRDGDVEHHAGPTSVWFDPLEHETIETLPAIELGPDEAIAIYRGEKTERNRSLLRGRAVYVPQVDETVVRLEPHSAGPSEYLVVENRDGTRRHLPGPASVLFDPVLQKSVRVEQAVNLDANEAVVVYEAPPEDEARSVTRRVVRGPELFVPCEREWLHRFRWHGADPKCPTRKVPRALQFEKLRVIPDQMYFDVEDVRTADDALVVIKLMIFFELRDINRMLDQTHDPVADFVNAVSADVINLVSTLNFEQFKEQTERLNDMDTYVRLRQRGEAVGYHIAKVVYRGYHASTTLQTMHDNAIETRTRLRLEAETETQAQELQDMKLRCEQERAAQRQQIATEEAQHQARLSRLEHDEKMRQASEEREAELLDARRRKELEREHERTMNQQKADLLEAMRKLDVDLTRYLVAQNEKPDRLIRVDGGTRPRMHLHEN